MGLVMPGELTRRNRRQGACVLIAIKERARCKTRLSPALAPLVRIQLVRSMLRAALSAAGAARTVRQILVLSPERDCVPAEIPVLVDAGADLNSALTYAHRMLRDFGCHEVVILPADLPDISAAEIEDLVYAGRDGGFAIAPDTAGTGTNALCLVSPQAFRFQFGEDSRRLHVQEALRAGLSPQVIRRPGLEFDVDWPQDLNRLDERRWLARQA